MIHTLTFAQFDFGLVAAGVGLLILFLLIGVTPLVWVIATAWEGMAKLRLKAVLKQQVIALKQQMIERGMTADEIVQVLGPPCEALDDLSEEEDDEAGVVSGPYAGEVVVEREGYEGSWHSALVLRRSGDRYLVHTCPGYEGCELPGNEWVKADRVRFPASSSGQDGSPGIRPTAPGPSTPASGAASRRRSRCQPRSNRQPHGVPSSRAADISATGSVSSSRLFIVLRRSSRLVWPWLFVRSPPLGFAQHLVQLGPVEEPAPDDDGVDPPGIGDVGERIGVEEDEVGIRAGGHGS